MTKTVLIVGAGPVGLTAATELARYGIPVRIVDKAPQRTDKSKALVLWSRTLELLDRGGGSAPFVDAGFKVHAVNVVARAGELMGRVTLDSVDGPYPYALMLPQSETERLLEERLLALGVTVERNVEVTSLTNSDTNVQAVLRHPDASEETVSADWLLGCDGAHSLVRSTVGTEFAGETMLSDWMLADIHMSGYPYPDTEVAVYWHRDGVFVIFPISPGRYRLIADLPMTSSERPPTPTMEKVQALVDQRGPKGMVVSDPIWLAGFRINGRKVSDYRSGRMFLLGDAAHIHSPAGGQGMNTGMQDAFNLAWKLAMVIKGTCGDKVLDSYSPERSKVGEQVLKDAGRLTAMGAAKNPLAQYARNIVSHFVLGIASVREKIADGMAEVAIGYPDSPLNGPALRGANGPKPGERVMPVSGQSFVGAGDAPRFALFAEPSQSVTDLLHRYDVLLDPELRSPLIAGGMTLVRPDGYVACSGKTAEDVANYLNGLR
ncbi:FAD-dependent monooxygenase [Rhodanobacter sp. MP7CTX1]|uniref:FAD-dependent monooxygenase n=1 Tax=Rhodanobacter sp. MP7CTX1 TaxID=2723084 RepID=UPI0016194397|nr:FAD-dependent monooxygenase [Rhodanobacter sp. MP7CTX1]MBB6185962.1 2-polyprenyl-6-methoxyphenol hydroxylase-like FAD-dependent oxidoreductase [Rhodanobacter sp. MP7CTX1]